MAPRKARSRRSSSRRSSLPQLQLIDGIEVWVTKKSIKNMHLRVKEPDGRVELSVPWHVSERIVEDFVCEKHDWIEARKVELNGSPRSFAAHASKAEIERWRKQIKEATPPLIAQWEQVIGVHAQTLAYRNMTSRWGSCTPATGRICINIRLALYPSECLEYVIVHELCHLLECGHGPRFKALMDTYLPDWRKRRDLLRV